MIVEKQPMSFGQYLHKFDDLTTQLHDLEMEMDDKYKIHKKKDREKSEKEYEKIKGELQTAKQMTKLLPIDAILKHDKKDVKEGVSKEYELRYGTEVNNKQLRAFCELAISAMKNQSGKLSSTMKFKDKKSEYMFANISSYEQFRLYSLDHISQKVELHDKDTSEREIGELHFVYKNGRQTVYIDEWID
jgi:hypothetical protein